MVCFVYVNNFTYFAFAQFVDHKAHKEYTYYVGVGHHENCKSKRSIVSATNTEEQQLISPSWRNYSTNY